MAHDDALREAIGLQILQLSTNFSSWVPRREETIEILNAELVRRTVQVHIDLCDRFADESLALWYDVILAPVVILGRQHNATFDVRAEDGSTVPRFTRGEERDLLVQGVLQRARTIVGKLRLDERTEAALTAAILDPTGDLSKAGTEWRKFPDFDDLDLKIILAHDYMMDTLRFAAEFFHLLVPLDPNDGLRRVLSYSYLWPLQVPRLRLQGIEACIDIPAAEFCRSYHLTVQSPPDLRICRAVATFTPLKAESEPTVEAPPAEALAEELATVEASESADREHMASDESQPMIAPIRVEDDSLLPNHAHIHAENVRSLQSARFEFDLAVSPTSVVRTAVLASALAFLAVLAHFIHDIPRPDSLDQASPATTTLLLLFPGALGPILSTIPRHPLTQSLLVPTRVFLWVSGIACYGAAALVAFEADGALGATAWGAVLAMSVASLLVLALQWRGLARAGPAGHATRRFGASSATRSGRDDAER